MSDIESILRTTAKRAYAQFNVELAMVLNDAADEIKRLDDTLTETDAMWAMYDAMKTVPSENHGRMLIWLITKFGQGQTFVPDPEVAEREEP